MSNQKPRESTFSLYGDFAGSRVTGDDKLEEACETFDGLNCANLLSVLTFMSQSRLGGVAMRDVLKGNRFHEPSEVSQRDFHLVEQKIFQTLPDIEFIELSPLQPFGTNSLLAGVSVKNIVPALRRSEVSADATTSLFREAIMKFSMADQNPTRLATNTRTTRAQSFKADSRFLPHFKMFAEVSVGKHGCLYGEDELISLIKHLQSEIDILEHCTEGGLFEIAQYEMSIGNLLLMQDLIDRGLVSEDIVRRNTATPDFNILDKAAVDLPTTIPMSTENLGSVLKDLGFTKGIRVTLLFQNLLMREAPELVQHLSLDFSRIAGMGYYKHMCYKIRAKNEGGIWLPLADGGTTQWGQKSLQNKGVYTVTSGIGTELFCRYFMTDHGDRLERV